MASDKKTVINFLWRFAERFTAQIVTIVVFILLARILEPQVFGTIAILMVFISVLQVFIDSGLGTALIQKKNVNSTDFSSVFIFNIIICILLYLIMFFSAPLIARFFNDLQLIELIRVISLLLIISGVKNIQQAYVSRNLIFKKFFYSTIIGTVISAIIGVVMAYKGFGIWALVAQYLSNAAIDTTILWFTVKWRPKLLFCWKNLTVLLNYSWKLLVSTLLDTIYNNIRQLLIGKLYTKSDLAFYNKGFQIPSMVIANVNSSLDSILLPVMSKKQDDISEIKETTRKAIKVMVYVIAPIMIGMFATSEIFIKLIFTDKWLPAVPYIQIFSLTFILWPIHTTNLNVMKSLGRSDLFLKLEIIKKIFGIIVLVSTMWFGTLVMAYSMLFLGIISSVINAYPNKKLINYSYIQQIKDIIPSLILSTITGVIIYCIKFIALNLALTLLIQIILGTITYISLSYLFKLDTVFYINNLIRNFKKKD